MDDQSKTRIYEGQKIVACPHKLAEANKWSTDIEIWKQGSGGSKVTPASAANTFDTEEEAVKYCFLFGNKIIDGDIVLKK